MTEESQKAGGVKRPIVLRPWLVVLAALILYGFTLNHWVTLGSLSFAAKICGWDWHPGPLPWRPDFQYPLSLLLTWPLRWLPQGWRPIGLNVLTAVCAALTLGALARSVRLISAVRTNSAQWWEKAEFALPSRGAALLPALFAVLLLGTQLTFWQNAVTGTNEMTNLLVFALLIQCLLEYRATEKEGWLAGFAPLYGVGVANNWALLGFFPCFLGAVIWMIWSRRLGGANLRSEENRGDGVLLGLWLKRVFLLNRTLAIKVIGCGGAGLLLYGLIPLLGAIHGDAGFGELLRQKFQEQHYFLTRTPRYFAIIAGAVTLAPLLFAAIKWPSGEGDTAPGAGLTRLVFRSLNVVCLAVGVLLFFDVKWSPNPRGMGMGLVPGEPAFLSFYYLAALNVGYFSGYVWRTFCQQQQSCDGPDGLAGGAPVYGMDPWSREQRARLGRLGRRAALVLLGASAMGWPTVLFYKNYPQIAIIDSPVLADFGKDLADSMPGGRAVIVADDPARLYLAMGAGERTPGSPEYMFVEGQSLGHREYLTYLADRYPDFAKELPKTNGLPEQLTGRQVGEIMARLAQRETVYYLEPGGGAGFEPVCLTPHRLGGYAHLAPTNVLETLSLSPGAIATNQAWWRAQEGQPLLKLLELAKTNADARWAADCYSQSANYWGTELQKAGTRRKLPALLADAHAQFAAAINLNRANGMARANDECNAELRGAWRSGPMATASNAIVRWDDHWETALAVNGPPDNPDVNIRVGRDFARRGLYRQAAALFQRSLELAPENAEAELDLANTYVDLGLADAAMALITDAQKHSVGNSADLAGVEALACAAKNDFARADSLLAQAHSKNPQDDHFTGDMAEIYRLMGYRILRESKPDAGNAAHTNEAANVWFKKALTAFDEHRQFLDRRMADLPESDLANLRVAEMQRMITNIP